MLTNATQHLKFEGKFKKDTAKKKKRERESFKKKYGDHRGWLSPKFLKIIQAAK